MFKAIKETVTDVRQLVRSCQGLTTNVKQLQDSLPAVNKFQAEVQKDIAKWQFKDQPKVQTAEILVGSKNDAQDIIDQLNNSSDKYKTFKKQSSSRWKMNSNV